MEKTKKDTQFFQVAQGAGKSHVLHLIQRDMSHFSKHTVKPDDDQPILLITAPTGSAAFQIGGTTIHSAFLLHDNYKSKPSWEKRSQMQLKLEYMMLSITDEISMVGFKQSQSMNQTVHALKGTTDGNWGDICVLAVGGLYQLPPVGQCPIYMSPQTVHTLNDIASNGWEKMQLLELTQSMRQKDMKFVNFLNKICTPAFNTLIVFTLPSSLQWRTTRRMGPSPSWTPVSNLRLMAAYLSLCTGNPCVQTSTYSGIAIITSQPSLVSSIPSPIGPKQCAVSMSCSNKKRTTSGRLSPNGNILNGLWTWWRKDLTGPPEGSLMGLIAKALQVPRLSLVKSKPRATLLCPTHKVFVKVSKRSVVDMAFKPASKVAVPSKNSWSPPRTKTLLSTKVVPYTGTSVVT